MDTKYLKKIRQGWYVYIRVPSKISPIIGKQFITRTLGTRDLKQANKAKYAAIAQINAYFDAVIKAKGADTPLSELTAAAKVISKELQLNYSDRGQALDQWVSMANKIEPVSAIKNEPLFQDEISY